MALTLSQLKRGSLDGSAFRIYSITHDGSTTSVSAASMDLDYIEAVLAHHVNISMQANTSLPLAMNKISINASNTGVTWSEVDANAISILTVIGW